MPLATHQDSAGTGTQCAMVDIAMVPSRRHAKPISALRYPALLGLLLLLPLPAELPAQYAVGVGLTLPTGDFANAAKPGWMLAAGYSPWRSTSGALRLWLQGYYGENTTESLDNTGGNHLAMAGVGLSIKPLPARVTPSPYLIVASGYLHHRQAGDAEGALYLGMGAGISFGRSWLQARYQAAAVDGGSLGFVLVAVGTSL